MSKELERSRAERDKWAKKVEEAERVLAEVTEQYEHQLQRYKNYQKYVEKDERAKRTHRLFTIGGTVEGLAPEVKELSTPPLHAQRIAPGKGCTATTTANTAPTLTRAV